MAVRLRLGCGSVAIRVYSLYRARRVVSERQNYARFSDMASQLIKREVVPGAPQRRLECDGEYNTTQYPDTLLHKTT